MESRTGPGLSSGDFAARTDPYRPELLGYAYRMLGGLHDAEDAVQETYLRAWQARAQFAGRSSVRSWLYRIATNVCLRAIERGARRPLPSGLGAPQEELEGLPRQAHLDSAGWLQPMPDRLLVTESSDPAEAALARSSVRLAFVAAVQYLPARQRAVLILRDVYAWPALAVAELLDLTVASVTSALQRARTHLARVAPVEDDVDQPSDAARRAQVERYVTAFESADIDALVGVLRADVVWEMPPHAQWYAGRDAVARFLSSTVLGRPGTWKLVPTSANGRPALASYLAGPDGRHHPHAIQVLEPTPCGIVSAVAFLDPALFSRFALPATR